MVYIFFCIMDEAHILFADLSQSSSLDLLCELWLLKIYILTIFHLNLSLLSYICSFKFYFFSYGNGFKRQDSITTNPCCSNCSIFVTGTVLLFIKRMFRICYSEYLSLILSFDTTNGLMMFGITYPCEHLPICKWNKLFLCIF